MRLKIFKTFVIWLSNADGIDKERAIWRQVLHLWGAKVIWLDAGFAVDSCGLLDRKPKLFFVVVV